MGEPEDFVVCRICGKEFQLINRPHLKKHDMTPEEYQSEFPGAPIISEKARKKRSVATIEQWKDPEFRVKQSADAIERWKNPEYRANRTGKNNPMYGRTGKDAPMYGKNHSEETKAKMSVAATERFQNPENRAKLSASVTEQWKDPGYRAKQIAANIERWKDPEFHARMVGKNHPMYGRTHTKEARANISAAMRERMKDPENHPTKRPEVRTKISASVIEHFKDNIEARAKMSVAATERWKDPEYRAKISAKISACLTGENHPNWQGGSSFLPYCHLFNNNLKEQVRNRYGRVCVNCEKSEIENGQRLSVHHVDGNKMQGCDGHEWFLVPLCRSCNIKKFDDLKLENHPFYITLFMFKDMERKTREQRINGG